MTKADKALSMARAVLDGGVCECGHFESSHYGPYTAQFQATGKCGDKGCRCPKMRAVSFVVRRVKR